MTSIADHDAGQHQDRDRLRAEVVADTGGLLRVYGVTGTGPLGSLPSAPGLPVLAADEVASVISMAARAPSLHNSQPWKFRVRPDAIELLADPDRKLAAVDPEGRELMISCGAAVFGLRLGLRRLGRVPAVELQPDPAQPWLVARVWPVGHAGRTAAESDLIGAVPHRHTHRGAFARGEVPARLLASLVADAAAEGGQLLLLTDAQVIAKLGRLVRRAAAQQGANPEAAAELARWVRPLGSTARDGIPATSRLADLADADTPPGDGGTAHWLKLSSRRALASHPGRISARDFGSPGTQERGDEPSLATAVLMTAGDTQADWLRAGQALDRVLLRAAARWVFASLQSQPIESPRHRQSVRALIGGAGYPQLLLQLGRANTAPATARRPQAEMLVTE